MVHKTLNLQEKVFDFFDNIENYSEIKILSNKIKKMCKKNCINSMFMKMYLQISKKILKKVNEENKHTEIEEKYKLFYLRLITQKVYQLNKEFPYLILFKFYNSANALTRIMVELYIQILYCRAKPEYMKELIENPEEKFSNKKEKIKDLKRARITIPYIKNMDEENFLEAVYYDFKCFSGRLHPSSMAFAENIWIWNEEKNTTRYYIQNSSCQKSEMIILFPKQSVLSQEFIQIMIHQFFVYSGWVLEELKLMDS